MQKEELLKVAKPILFNTEMVKAILEERKTVTRRLIKPQPTKDMIHKLGFCVDGDKKDIGKFVFGSNECGGHVRYVKPPYKIGNILYLRETWSEWTGGYIYRAWNGPFPQAGKSTYMRWYPSIHMPKEAARIFLKVKDVRVERLQEITEEQALAEGVPDDWSMDAVYCPRCHGYGLVGALSENLGFMEVDCKACEKAVTRFKNLWNSTIKKSDLEFYGWDANPWVWVIEFERIEV